MMSRYFSPMPISSIQQAVARAIGTPANPSGLRVLDLSCGDGDILAALAVKGFHVEGTHFKEDDYIFRNPSPLLKTITVHKGVNLTRPLPLPDAAYDIVLATEVLEHLPSFTGIVSEIGRILKPGGQFICTTPNLHRLANRAQFFLTGTHDLCGARLGWHIPPEDLYSTHFSPVYFPVFHTLLHHQGMHVDQLRIASVPFWDALLLPLYPLLAAATAWEMLHFIKRSRTGGRDLLRAMLHPALFLSKHIVVSARKDNPPEPA
jgi:SAM-dependent methyltransferase